MEIIMDQVCHAALHSAEYAEDDVAFSDANEANCMMFVKSGKFFYSRTNTNLVDAAWISEASLWASWWHRGSLVAKGNVNELIEVMHAPFGEVMCSHPSPWYFAHSYATEFLARINDIDHTELTDVTLLDDIEVGLLWHSCYERSATPVPAPANSAREISLA
mmetsp:Transcript_117379/g.183404  ORF Transcript_117379/g.183404 Transcript_117379/m.183404 type:complete len:162 (+) Transcript_117379:3-488(+)